MEEANKENEFERLLKQKAERFEVKPSPEVWQNVRAAIRQDRRQRFAWWLLAALLFTVLGTGAYFMLERKSGQPSVSATVGNEADKKASSQNNYSFSGKKEDEEKQSAKAANTNPVDSQMQREEKSANEITAEKTSSQNQKKQPFGSYRPKEKSSTTASIISNETFLHTAPENELVTILAHELIQPLSQKEPGLLFNDGDLLFKKPTPDFSSMAASGYSLCFEADAMPLASFVWNHALPSADSTNTSALASSVYNSSYSFVKGFSTGGNFVLELNKKWLFGIGAHLSKTHLEAITAERTIPQYDTGFVTTGDTTLMEIVYTGNAIVQQSQHSANQWLDVSLMAGVRLFPGSKNHIRMLAGAGYSRLLANKISAEQTNLSTVDVTFSGAGPFAAIAEPAISYQKNQLQLFSEIAYSHDLTSRLSFSTGLQVHYYPMNLLNSNEISQQMMWIGLKGGLLFRL